MKDYPYKDPNAPTVEECLKAHGISGAKAEDARKAFRSWLSSWNGLEMKAEELRNRV